MHLKPSLKGLRMEWSQGTEQISDPTKVRECQRSAGAREKIMQGQIKGRGMGEGTVWTGDPECTLVGGDIGTD